MLQNKKREFVNSETTLGRQSATTGRWHYFSKTAVESAYAPESGRWIGVIGFDQLNGSSKAKIDGKEK